MCDLRQTVIASLASIAAKRAAIGGSSLTMEESCFTLSPPLLLLSRCGGGLPVLLLFH
jgi:hypothetical protein